MYNESSDLVTYSNLQQRNLPVEDPTELGMLLRCLLGLGGRPFAQLADPVWKLAQVLLGCLGFGAQVCAVLHPPQLHKVLHDVSIVGSCVDARPLGNLQKAPCRQIYISRIEER
jgi:hypothetical protein